MIPKQDSTSRTVILFSFGVALSCLFVCGHYRMDAFFSCFQVCQCLTFGDVHVNEQHNLLKYKGIRNYNYK